jgi:thiamine transporter ThiT
MNTSVKLYSLNVTNYRTYLFTTLFVAGNILLPQLVHMIPQGGLVWLPIYFFTLVAAYKFGIVAGLLTALLSPLINNLLFGMPSAEMLPILFSKSILLAIAASWAARSFQRVSIPALILTVIAYQVAGTMVEWLIVKDFYVAIQDFRIGFPGMLAQVFGGFLVLKALSRV